MSIVRTQLKSRYVGEEGFRIRVIAITDEETSAPLDLNPFDIVQIETTKPPLVSTVPPTLETVIWAGVITDATGGVFEVTVPADALDIAGKYHLQAVVIETGISELVGDPFFMTVLERPPTVIT